MRLAVYTDYAYRRDDAKRIYGERAFVLFLLGVGERVEHLTLVGRLHPEPGRSRYPLPPEVPLVPLPHYSSMIKPSQSLPALARSLGRFWRMLDDVDAVWLLGPNIYAVAFSLLAALRRRTVVLGVRQDLPEYARTRHPGRRWVHAAAVTLDWVFRRLASRFPVIVVGPQLARAYSAGARVLPITVSLIRREDIVAAGEIHPPARDGPLRVLSVGRLEQEKNPLLVADVLARLRERDERWRLAVVGEGVLEDALRTRLEQLGLAVHADIHGYVPHEQLKELYRESDAFLHVSWTEGLPQVLFEAFAAGLPVVATGVGGVPEAVGDAALVIPPGDAPAAADALGRILSDRSLRDALVEAGRERVVARTLDAECDRVVDFIRQSIVDP